MVAEKKKVWDKSFYVTKHKETKSISKTKLILSCKGQEVLYTVRSPFAVFSFFGFSIFGGSNEEELK